MRRTKNLLLYLLLSTIYTYSYSQSPDENLLLYYPVHGNINDESGHELNGVLQGATLTTDRFGLLDEAYYFQGLNAYIAIPSSPILHPKLPFSVSLWVYFDDLNNYYGIFSSDYAESLYTGFWISLGANNGQKVIGISYGDGGLVGDPAARCSKMGTTPIQEKIWYHITGVFRGPTDMDIYVNCINDNGKYDGTGGSIQYSNNPGSLGRHNSSNNILPPSYYYLKGKLDEVKVFNKALTEMEVQKECGEKFYASYIYKGECLTQNFEFQYNGTTDMDSIKWDFGDPNSAQNNYSKISNPIHKFSEAGEFNVSVEVFLKNIKTQYNKTIKVLGLPKIYLGEDTTLCIGQKLNLNPGNAGSYLWNTGSTSPSIQINMAGLYSVKVTELCGVVYDTIKVEYSTFSDVYLPTDTSVCKDQVFVATAQGPDIYTYVWENSISAKSLQLMVSNSTKIRLMVSDKFFCTKTYFLNISGNDCLEKIEIPNVFTPNGDGFNDYWIITNIEKYPRAVVEVFNRWGNLVYSSVGMLTFWDGLFNGLKVSSGCYFYVITLNNGTEAFKGPLMVYW